MIYILLYYHQNDVFSREELAQLIDMFKLIEDVNQEMTELDDNYTEQLWFADIDEKVFSLKQKFHNWLKEGYETQKTEKKNQDHHVRDLQAPTYYPSHQITNHRSYKTKKESHPREGTMSRSSSRSSFHAEEKICRVAC